MAFLKRSLILTASTLSIFTMVSAVEAGAKDSKVTKFAEKGINISFMDKKYPPGKDFYLYANGTWMKDTPIPDEYDKWGVLNIIRDQNLAKLKTIMEAAAENKDAKPGSNEQKIGDFFYTGMDKKTREEQDMKPLKPYLEAIDKISDVKSLQETVCNLHENGIRALFRVGSGQDFKDSESVIGQAYQGGLGLPDRDYYTKDDKKSVELREKYVKHVARMLKLLGVEDAEAKSKIVMDLETKMAKASMKNTDRRNPDKVYHKMTMAEFDKLTPNISWTGYFKQLDHSDIKDINVGQPEFFKALNDMLKSEPLDNWKTYLKWHLVDGTCSYLSDRFVDANFDFFGKTLTGKKENLPRWKRVANTIDVYIGEALGQLYVKDNFNPEAKKLALRLVNKIKEVLREDLETLEWMDKTTRKNAIAKMDQFGLKIGYPDKWRDYSKLDITRDSYVGNIMRGSKFEFHRQLNKVGKPVDRGEWFMNAQTVNAYYSPVMNEIVFPAGILQPPIFNPKSDDAINLGAMGMVIGHEMTHGFDDQGSKFDGKGNLKNWWSKDDLKRFKERIALIETQYEGYKVGAGTNFKGKLVAGEAAADLGGLTLAYKALKKLNPKYNTEKDENGFTAEQRFFLSFAQAWATNIRPEKERMMTAVDPHPTPHFRVNGTLANMDVFEKAFPLGDERSMMLPNDKRCRLW